MNNPTIPASHFWNPKQVKPKTPSSRMRENQLSALGIEHDVNPLPRTPMPKSTKEGKGLRWFLSQKTHIIK